MSVPLPQLQRLLLDLLSSVRPVDPTAVAKLTAGEWETLLRMARQHRLFPLLHWRLTHERRDLPIPEAVRATLAAGFRHSALRALRLQRELLLTHHHLEAADIPHIALKGAFLAFHAYPHPALRPMRDLDILVPETVALEAYRVLLDSGFTRPQKYYRGNLEAALRTHHHLPPLYCPRGRVSVELHARFSRAPDEDGPPDLIDAPELWERTVDHAVTGDALRYLSPTDLLLHLIEHAVYSHRFDNGPLVLSDLAYLLEGHPIDWALFWQRAQHHGQTRGALLLLKMVERYFGKQPIEWSGAGETEHGSIDALVEKASLLTLRARSARYDRLTKHSTLGKKFRILLREVFVSRRAIASRYPVAEDSPRIYLWYFARLWRLLTVHLPEYLATRRGDRSANETANRLRLEQWLQETPSGGDAR